MIHKTVYIGCRVSEEFREKFTKLAKEKNTTLSKILRKLIKKYIKEAKGSE